MKALVWIGVMLFIAFSAFWIYLLFVEAHKVHGRKPTDEPDPNDMPDQEWWSFTQNFKDRKP